MGILAAPKQVLGAELLQNVSLYHPQNSRIGLTSHLHPDAAVTGCWSGGGDGGGTDPPQLIQWFS